MYDLDNRIYSCRNYYPNPIIEISIWNHIEKEIVKNIVMQDSSF